MNTSTQIPKKQASYKSLTQKTPAVATALALGAGLTAPSDANAALVLTNIDQTVENDSFNVDIDNNRVADFQVTDIGKGGPKKLKVGGFIRGLTKLNSVSNGTKFAAQLAEGDNVDANLFNGVSGTGDQFATLYSADIGPWGSVGATGFLGLQFVINGANHYGFLQVTRGSAILGLAGYETTPDTPVQISTVPPTVVPVPATVWLFGSAMVGLVGLGRRKRTTTLVEGVH